MKKIAIGLLSLSFLASGGCLVGCHNSNESANLESPKAEADGYISIDINPSIEIIVDQYGKVMNLHASNDDARVLLYNETGIVGLQVEDAVKKITTLAKNLGYLSNNDVVGVISEGISQNKLSKITTAITTSAQNLGLAVTTNLNGGFALERAFEEFKSKYPNNATIQNLTITKFKLAQSVCETSSTNLEVAIELEDSTLIDMLNDNISKIEIFMTEGFQHARDIAQSEFEQAKLFSIDIAYIYWFNQYISYRPSDSYLGALYVLYHATGKGLDLIANTIENNFQIKNHILSQEHVDEIILLLNLPNSDLLENSNGDITIMSVENYLNTQMQKNPNFNWTTTKVEIDTILDDVESCVMNDITITRDTYLSQITGIFEKTKFAFDSLETIYEILNGDESTKQTATYVSEQIETYNNMVATLRIFMGNDNIIFSLNELKQVSKALLDIAKTLKTDIDETLTNSEKDQIELIKNASSTQLGSAQLILEQALEIAETKAKETLSNLKAEKLS